MSIGLVGKKIGMTRVFDEDGNAMAVTVVDVSDNAFLQVKTEESDGYSAVQVGFDDQKEQRLNSPLKGHFQKNKVKPKKMVREFRLETGEELPETHPGAELFEAGQYVDVIGTSKGKGFQGVYKRYGFGGLPASHGSMMHRRTGGIGCGTDPGRVWKNKEMPGHHGNVRKTVQNLKVIQVRVDDQVLLIQGAIPGATGNYVLVRPAKKRKAPGQNSAGADKKK